MNLRYRNYLLSDAWQQKRKAVFERAQRNANTNNRLGVCEKCGYKPWKPNLQIHHLTYERIYNEPLDDLILLCPRCHYEETVKQKKLKQGLPVYSE